MYCLFAIAITGMCFISYTIGRMHSQIETDLSNKSIQVASPGLSRMPQIIKEERTFEKKLYPRHNKVGIFNVSNIRPVIQLNKEIYHINDRLYAYTIVLLS